MLKLDDTLEERLMAYATGALSSAERMRVESLVREGSTHVTDRLQSLLTSRRVDADRGIASAADERINARLEQMIEEAERRRLLHRVEHLGTDRPHRSREWVGRAVGLTLVAAGLVATGAWFYLMQRHNAWHRLVDKPIAVPSKHMPVQTEQASASSQNSAHRPVTQEEMETGQMQMRSNLLQKLMTPFARDTVLNIDASAHP